MVVDLPQPLHRVFLAETLHREAEAEEEEEESRETFTTAAAE